MATVLGEFATEEQRSLVHFYGQNDSMHMTVMKKYF
jgi:hypothetical protein